MAYFFLWYVFTPTFCLRSYPSFFFSVPLLYFFLSAAQRPAVSGLYFPYRDSLLSQRVSRLFQLCCFSLSSSLSYFFLMEGFTQSGVNRETRPALGFWTQRLCRWFLSQHASVCVRDHTAILPVLTELWSKETERAKKTRGGRHSNESLREWVERRKRRELSKAGEREME